MAILDLFFSNLKLLYLRTFNKKKFQRYRILVWLKKARAHFIETKDCMCYSLLHTSPFKDIHIQKHIPEYFPAFFNTQESGVDGYWWPQGDIKSRIWAFSKLIELYEKDN